MKKLEDKFDEFTISIIKDLATKTLECKWNYIEEENLYDIWDQCSFYNYFDHECNFCPINKMFGTWEKCNFFPSEDQYGVARYINNKECVRFIKNVNKFILLVKKFLKDLSKGKYNKKIVNRMLKLANNYGSIGI